MSVLLTAIPLAMLLGFAGSRYWDASAAGFLLLVMVGVLVPYAHETHWPQDRPWQRNVLWTVAASAVACALFAGSHLIASALVADPTHAAVVAFSATALGGTGLLRLRGDPFTFAPVRSRLLERTDPESVIIRPFDSTQS